jgi:hypothetical protein
MSATNDGYTIPSYNDGQALIETDLNKTSRKPLARLTDQFLERMTGYLAVAAADPDTWSENSLDGGGDDTILQSLIYTMTGGDCLVHGTGTTISISTGTMFQKATGVDMEQSSLIPFYLTDGDGAADGTIAAGDATNPRIDIIQVKLEWKDAGTVSRDFKDGVTGALSSQAMSVERYVQATFSIKQGTPAATPSYPALDAGYALLAAVRVPALWTTGFSADALGASSAIIRQCSVPLGIEAITMNANEFDYGAASNWSENTHGEAEATGAGSNLRVWCPRAGQTKRIVGVEITAAWVTSGTTTLCTKRWTSTISHFVSTGVTFDLSGTLVVVGGTVQSKFAHLGVIADASSVSNPSAANGPVGDAMWAKGGVSGPGFQAIRQQTNHFARACLEIAAGVGTVIAEVTWYLAG